MSKRIAEIQESISAALNKLPDVFSTVQWGGRAYKLPGPGGNRKKPKLLAHTWLNDEGDAVGISFKLDRKRAAEVVDQFRGWIAPHSFRTLAPSGWVTAEVRTKSQCTAAIKLLTESRALYADSEAPPSSPAPPARPGKPKPEIHAIDRRIDLILREKKAAGWSPDAG